MSLIPLWSNRPDYDVEHFISNPSVLVFDFLNGFHDSANSIATIVSTRVLKPKYAVLWAAFFNFIAFLFLGLHVANTIGKGIIDIAIVDQRIILARLLVPAVGT